MSERKPTKLKDQASFLISARAAVSLLVVTAIVPALSYLFLERLQAAVTVKDKRLTQISGMFLVIGSSTKSLAPTAVMLVLSRVLFALSFAFKITARNFITSLAEPKRLGALYTVIAAISHAGILVGSPLLAASFSWGMRLGRLLIRPAIFDCIGIVYSRYVGCFSISWVVPWLKDRSWESIYKNICLTTTPLQATYLLTGTMCEYKGKTDDGVFIPLMRLRPNKATASSLSLDQ